MNVLFIWPNRDTFGTKPIGISMLSALLNKAGHKTDLFDTTFYDVGITDYNEDLTSKGYFKPVDWGVDVSKKKVSVKDALKKKLEAFNPDVVAISVLSDEVELAVSLLDLIKVPIVVGNKGVDKFRQQTAMRGGITYYFGEALENFVKTIENLKDKNQNYCEVIQSPGFFKNIDSLPYLDWDMFDDRHFLKAYDGKVYRGGDYMVGWGCTNSCTYCVNEYWRNLHGGSGGCMRFMSTDMVTEELDHLRNKYRLNFIKFHDEDFLLKAAPYFEDLARLYIETINLPFVCMTNAKSVTPHKARILTEMGCKSVSIGIETGDPTMRQILNRRETPDNIIYAVNILQMNGIRVSAFNMIGLPYETERTVEATIKLNKEAGIAHPNISFFMPLEGTRLYDISVAAGFFNPRSGKELRTDRPTLKLPGISEKKLLYYYDNFHKLVTGE